MKQIMTTLAILLFLSLQTRAATEFNMSFSTLQPGGTYKPRNVVAVWVTMNDGTFIKTLLRYADGHRGDLTTWKAAAGPFDADAVLGATRDNHTAPTVMRATWDLRNKSGVVVPDGTYKIRMECADGSRAAHTFNFAKNTTAGTRTDPGTAVFKNISISYAPPPPNIPPVAQAQSVTTPEDTTRTLVLAATDAEGSTLTYALVTEPTHGTLDGTAPNLTYTPAPNYTGPDDFTFKANDGTADSSPATVAITVSAVNDTPVAHAQNVTTPEDTVQAITLTATDVDGDALTYTVVANPAHGMLSGILPNLSYTPAPGYLGTDSLTFKANDGTVDSAVVTVSITVNNAPVAQAQTVTTPEDTALGITLAATDAEGIALTYAMVTGPAHGTLSGTAPNITYAPASNYNGADSFTFIANDGTLDSAPAIVSITVSSVNDVPVAQAQSISTPEDTAKAVTLAATDVDGDPLTYTVVTAPAHGVLSGTPPAVTYTPALNYSGADSFTFKADDGTADSSPATVSVTVTSINDAPVAQAQTVTTPEDTALGITLAATDAEGIALTYAMVTGPAHGTLSGTAPTVTYAPAPNYNGADSFTFKANDGALDSLSATVSITVSSVNDAPTAQSYHVSVWEDGTTATPLHATDVDGDALTYTVVDGPLHGILTGTAPNVSYTPAWDYFGDDDITYKASDGSLDSALAVIDIMVHPVNDAPVAQPQSITTSEDTAHAITLAAMDMERNALTYTVVTAPAHGTLTGLAPALLYTPALNYAGVDSFTFTANDGAADSMPATVSITVTAVNDAPVAQTQTVSAPGGAARTITLTASDVDGDALTYVVLIGPEHGTLTGNAPDLLYTPASPYSGTDTLTFQANDGIVDSAPAAVSIIVTTPPRSISTCILVVSNDKQPSTEFPSVGVTGF